MLCVRDIILIVAILSDIIYRLILIFCPKRYLRACYAILQAFNGSFCFRLESPRKMVYNILVYRVLRLETLCTDGFYVPINTVVCISHSVFFNLRIYD